MASRQLEVARGRPGKPFEPSVIGAIRRDRSEMTVSLPIPTGRVPVVVRPVIASRISTCPSPVPNTRRRSRDRAFESTSWMRLKLFAGRLLLLLLPIIVVVNVVLCVETSDASRLRTAVF